VWGGRPRRIAANLFAVNECDSLGIGVEDTWTLIGPHLAQERQKCIGISISISILGVKDAWTLTGPLLPTRSNKKNAHDNNTNTYKC